MYALSITVLWFALALIVLFPTRYADTVERVSKIYNVDSRLIQAVINVESGYNKNAESRVGAKGLMQLMPSTAAWIASTIGQPELSEKLDDPEANITLGTAYLKYLLSKFNLVDALAAYNAGEGNVANWNARRLAEYPFYETRVYVKKVLACKKVYSAFRRSC